MKEKIHERGSYPRPDFIRENWRDLNGIWKFAFDDCDTGYERGCHLGNDMDREILVPFCYQSKKSGIGDKCHHKTVWYCRKVDITKEELRLKCLFHIGACDYEADLWVNGSHAGKHIGGYTQCTFEIGKYLNAGENLIAIRVRDDLECDRARGKQYWKEKEERCWYTAVTGIWQNVWLEFTGETYLEQLRLTPDIDRRFLELELYFDEEGQKELEISIFYKGAIKKRVLTETNEKYTREGISLTEEDRIDELHYWSPDTPNLYEVMISLKKNGEKQDEVFSYFGMRKIHIANGYVFLNNHLFYQRLVLDQGYWEDTLLTPPSSEDLKRDVELTKKLGFNGARKHQKCEDPRYYYWADVLGLVVWGELPSGYLFNKSEVENQIREWGEFVNQTYNHPCVITWVPLNESWGVRNIIKDKRQQAFAKGLYYITKAYDDTRLISVNDGWEQVTETDIFGIHDYAENGEEIKRRYADFEEYLKTGIPNRQALSSGNQYRGQPVILTEYGGIAYKEVQGEKWGYNEAAWSEEEFVGRIENLTRTIEGLKIFRGFCYTQLTDVMQEVNGLLTVNREPKIEWQEMEGMFAENKTKNTFSVGGIF